MIMAYHRQALRSGLPMRREQISGRNLKGFAGVLSHIIAGSDTVNSDVRSGCCPYQQTTGFTRKVIAAMRRNLLRQR